MSFFTTAVTGLKTVVTAIGAGVGVWGVINLLEGYGNDNPGAKSQGIKQLISQILFLGFWIGHRGVIRLIEEIIGFQQPVPLKIKPGSPRGVKGNPKLM